RNPQVRNVKEILASPNNALVLVTAVIPPGIGKGDPLDVEIVLPQGSRATSLRGGYLHDCPLLNYESKNQLVKDYKGRDGNVLLPGHTLVHAGGPLLVGFGENSEEIGLRRGRIWEGGVSLIDEPLYLCLKSDQQSASIANA